MPRLKTHKRLAIDILVKILESDKTTTNQKIAAAKALAMYGQPKKLKKKKDPLSPLLG